MAKAPKKKPAAAANKEPKEKEIDLFEELKKVQRICNKIVKTPNRPAMIEPVTGIKIPGVSDLDKAEAFLVNSAMAFKLKVRILTKLSKTGQLDDPDDATLKRLQNIKIGLDVMIELYNTQYVTKMAKKVKDNLGDLDPDDLRAHLNAPGGLDMIADVIDDAEYFSKRIADLLKQKKK